MKKRAFALGLSAVLAVSVLASPPAFAAPDAGTFTEDFSNGLGDWTSTSGQWSAADGVASVTDTTVSGPKSMHLTSWEFGDFEATVTAQITEASTPTSWVGISTRMTEGQEDFRASGYTAFLRGNGQLALVKPHATDPTAVATIATASTGVDPRLAPVQLTLRAEGTTLEVFVDGAATPAISVTDAGYTRGKLGLTAGGAFASFRNLQVVHDDGAEVEPKPVAWGGVFLGDGSTANCGRASRAIPKTRHGSTCSARRISRSPATRRRRRSGRFRRSTRVRMRTVPSSMPSSTTRTRPMQPPSSTP
ncbi:family 16 glycoside hydrolase [Agromyces archimandritae]|uniref:family 16 glycoside hydrolase n=1 Tax=Agromyces archimandritae TaxID=2781962 RepID=UPI001FD268B8|nr:family 16 glycoside hydrolase [Agromyces archimandritae]